MYVIIIFFDVEYVLYVQLGLEDGYEIDAMMHVNGGGYDVIWHSRLLMEKFH